MLNKLVTPRFDRGVTDLYSLRLLALFAARLFQLDPRLRGDDSFFYYLGPRPLYLGPDFNPQPQPVYTQPPTPAVSHGAPADSG